VRLADDALNSTDPGSRIETVASSLLSSQLTRRPALPVGGEPRCLATEVFTFWHLASLDAPTVAVVWTFAIARSAHLHLELWIALLIATGTWTVYVFDRILDALRAIHAQTLSVLHQRHHFHWRHRRIFVPFATCSALGALAMIVELMPAAARQHDSIIAAAALVYFSGVHASPRLPEWIRRLCSKEMLVGMLFASGCAAPTLTRLHSGPVWPVLLSSIFLASLAWLNCAAISNWESDHSSIDISSVAVAIALIGVVIAIILAPTHGRTSALCAIGAVSAVLILGLHRSRNLFDAVTMRALADLVLLAPAVLLLPGALP
jgi:hypothetical protein